MKKILHSVTSFIVAMAMLAAPVVDAQTRGRQANGSHSGNTTSQRPSRPSHGGATDYRHQNGGHQNRPGNGNNRPGNQGNHNRPGGDRPQHPGNQGNHNRPGGNGRPDHRPGNNHPGNNRPGNNHRPDYGHRPDYRPDYRPGHNHSYRPSRPGYRPGVGPVRPHRPPRRHPHGFRHPVPFFNGFHRPVPPPRWHYAGGGPAFGTILGIALGTAIGASLTALANDGYAVSSYGNNVIYMNDVPQMNYIWPDAALYYNNGMLCGSQFTYPTSYYDMSRYNALYNTFVAQYGMPVSCSNTGAVISSSWFGPSGRYVTLSFNSQYGGNYYTTLSFGN